MVKTENDILTITCDKCGVSESHPTFIAQELFFENGWALFSRAKKYKHKCRRCQTPATRRTMKWAFEKFGHGKV